MRAEAGLDFNSRNAGGRIGHLLDQALLEQHRRQEGERLASRTPRIGASRLGESCLRKLQYEFFKAPRDRALKPATLRIFRRGHEGEAWVAEWLRLAGFTLLTAGTDGQQKCFRALDGKILGFADGVVTGGPAGAAVAADSEGGAFAERASANMRCDAGAGKDWFECKFCDWKDRCWGQI